MDWFQKTFGFKENKENIDKYISLSGNVLFIKDKIYQVGRLSTPTIEELRTHLPTTNGNIQISQITADVKELHRKKENEGALFQVASQFNLLEMISPQHTKEMGITIYIDDLTQGPICAMECAAGTIYRNYFSDVNTLSNISNFMNNRYFKVVNGYMLFDNLNDIKEMNKIILTNPNIILDYLKVGIQWDTEVIKTGFNVSQIYCSAVPVSYNEQMFETELAHLSILILKATYEAAIVAAILNKKSNKVFLTLVGNGAFGNKKEWIIEALEYVLERYKNYNLEIVFVKYENYIDTDLNKLENKYNS
jgi:hypothetical protein